METKVKKLLAEHIGVDADDIHDEDLLIDDLHMSPTEIFDFFSLLEDGGIDISKITIPDVKTVEDLLESVNSHEEM